MAKDNNTTVTRAVALAEFRKLFEQVGYGYGYSEIFTAFLDFALWMLNPYKTKEAYEDVKYIDKMFKESDAQHFCKMLEYWSIACDNDGEGFYDALGDLFMELVSHGRNGQFFTPHEVCDMMAIITCGTEIEDGKSVSDPACGSGRTMMAVAKINRKLKFYGADNDITCCKMAVLNLLANSMPGEIAWMDSLRMEHFKSWHIRLTMDISGRYIPYYYTTGKGETNFIERLKNTMQEAVPKHEPVQETQQIITPAAVQKPAGKPQLTLF